MSASLLEALPIILNVAVEANSPKISKLQCYEKINAGHGRIETRCFYLSTCLDTLPDAARWNELKSIGMVESERTFNGRTSVERRYYIYSVLMLSRSLMQHERNGVSRISYTGCLM